MTTQTPESFDKEVNDFTIQFKRFNAIVYKEIYNLDLNISIKLYALFLEHHIYREIK